MSGATVHGDLDISHRTVLAILDDEAQEAVDEATKRRAKVLNAAAPVGRTSGQKRPANPSGKKLSKSHTKSVRKTPFGWQGRVRRHADAWYGRIVERGRPDGEGYPAASANPFVDRADAALANEAERTLERGAVRAARRIQARL